MSERHGSAKAAVRNAFLRAHQSCAQITNANAQTPKKIQRSKPLIPFVIPLEFGVWFLEFFHLVIRTFTPASAISGFTLHEHG